jgi:hypothetical protein
MSRRICCLFFFLVPLLLICPTFGVAWEFKMTGEYEWRFRYLGRLGDRDLFGIMRLQDQGGPLIGFAGPNIFGRGSVQSVPSFNASNAGMRLTRGGFSESGSDAHYLEQRITLYPEINVNRAILFRSALTIGGYRNKFHRSTAGVGLPPYERYYMERTSTNGWDTFGTISFEQWSTLIQTPWGMISVGTKGSKIGIGATMADNTRGSALAVAAPYGPMRLSAAIWAGRSRFTDGWSTSPDRAEKRTSYGMLAVMYSSGALETGVVGIRSTFHANARESSPVFNNAPFDELLQIGIAYTKYFNGRFFCNFEFAFMNVDIHPIGQLPAFGIGRHILSETGVLVGPAKLSLMFAHTTGFDLNNPNPTVSRLPFAINYIALAPYEWLMFNTYAGGNNGGWIGVTFPLTNDEIGQLADAFAFAARLDFAAASNLNVWASYIWAHATEPNGGFAGGTASDGSVGNTTVAQAQAWKTLNGFGPNPNPYVDDGFLGWEVNIGLDWKLLENLTLNMRWAYWQPGPFFDQGFQAVTRRGGAVITDGLLVGRDPINAFEGRLLVEF